MRFRETLQIVKKATDSSSTSTSSGYGLFVGVEDKVLATTIFKVNNGYCDSIDLPLNNGARLQDHIQKGLNIFRGKLAIGRDVARSGQVLQERGLRVRTSRVRLSDCQFIIFYFPKISWIRSPLTVCKTRRICKNCVCTCFCGGDVFRLRCNQAMSIMPPHFRRQY